MGLHGKKDKGAPYHLAAAMQSGLKDSQMRTFPGGHVFFLLRLRQCIEAIVDFWVSSKLHVR
jgi:surfactin synthase thioesterase subunit